jgi:L-lactate dehydrogenase complex protein LldG
MERQAFLDRVRRRLDAGAPHHNLPHPLRPVDGIPEIAHPLRHGNPREVFAETAAEKKWKVRTVEDRAGLARLLAEVCEAEGVSAAAVGRDAQSAEAKVALTAQGIEVLPWETPRSPAAAGLGVTGAAFGLATTGTVALASSLVGGRAVALLPPAYLALLPASRIVVSTSAVWRHMPERFPDGPPSQLLFMSGPSRSADIEFTLTVGVHGPRSVWVAILDGR